MNGAAKHPGDLLNSRGAAWLLWGAPWALGFGVAGSACVENARR
jgi:hypothetical protein